MGMGHELGQVRPGFLADLLLVDGDPLQDVRILQRKDAIAAVHLDGRAVRIEERAYDPYKVTHLNSLKWTEVYTRERVAAK
jgi:hypothetical protein